MKFKNYILLLFFFSYSVAHSQPFNITGQFKRTQNIEWIVVKKHYLTSDDDKISLLKKDRYFCQKIDLRHLCTKSFFNPSIENYANLTQKILNSIPLDILFYSSDYEYDLTTDSELLKEWFKPQNIVFNNQIFDHILWRELSNSSQKITQKIIIKTKDLSIQDEFIIERNNQDLNLKKIKSLRENVNVNEWNIHTVMVTYAKN